MIPTIHHGRNLKRLRKLLDITQEVVAGKLDIVQQEYSKIEQQQEIDNVLLERIGAILRIHPDLIKNLEEQLIQNVHQYEGNKGVGFDCRKVDVEMYERLLEEKTHNAKLQEQLIKQKDEYIELLKQMAKKDD
ncbi:helix-turn-helix transcriptional regulator [Pedobacter frigoris]|uniref:helix-turn-helix domain-containing protein n=1 Tax=Pedobacter frigoris TaxID=2571272 RepID=UPI00292E9E40|nr:helix-turn-helix transcriptional regulator [Pedobacter frigoris]